MDSFEKFLDEWDLRGSHFDDQITLFATLLSICDKSPKTITTYISAIRSQYRLKGIEIENEFLLMRILRGVKSFKRGPRRVRLPLLVQQLPDILRQVSFVTTPYQASLYQAMILLAFHC